MLGLTLVPYYVSATGIFQCAHCSAGRAILGRLSRSQLINPRGGIKDFLQGLKAQVPRGLTSVLKPRPPEERIHETASRQCWNCSEKLPGVGLFRTALDGFRRTVGTREGKARACAESAVSLAPGQRDNKLESSVRGRESDNFDIL